MRVIRAIAHNFGSYSVLDFDFTKKGLALISGPTGSGKSTLADIIPWALFGVTAKGGLADEVCSWNSDMPTSVALYLEDLTIVRIRGGKTKSNDLYFYESSHENDVHGNFTRGKDLKDTQRLINQRLGITPETYLAGAYYHEFSQTASFFTTSAKVRRQITEQMADLDLSKTLALELTEKRKFVKKAKESNDIAIGVLQCNTESRKDDIAEMAKASITWENNQKSKKEDLNHKNENFDTIKESRLKDIQLLTANKVIELTYDLDSYKAQLQDQDVLTQKLNTLNDRLTSLPQDTCAECGAPKRHADQMLLTKQVYEAKEATRANERIQSNITNLEQRIQNTLDKSLKSLEIEQSRQNAYSEQLQQLDKEQNPFTPQVKQLKAKLSDIQAELLKLDTPALALELADLDLLSDLNDTFRSLCLKNTITSLEATTNKLLTDHFDAEIKVQFSSEDADKLEVLITKDGNECSYSQLSKGQRCLLKLCFGIAVMKSVADFQHTSFNILFADEALDGLSEELKLKSVGLFETLALTHESVFLIDHSPSLKALINNKIEVSLVNGESYIEEA